MIAITNNSMLYPQGTQDIFIEEYFTEEDLNQFQFASLKQLLQN